MTNYIDIGFRTLGIGFATFVAFWLLAKLVLVTVDSYRRLRASVKDLRRKVSILAGVLAAAEEWAVAENDLREQQADGNWVGANFNEEDHKRSLRADLTEQNLLDAVRKSWDYGIDLGAYRRWK